MITWSTSLRTAISSGTAHTNSWKNLRRWRWIQSRCCALLFTEGRCTITWHQKLPALLWIVPSQEAGVIWWPWPALRALSSVSGSSCRRCLTTTAPALRERGKGEGGKDARTAVNNPHLQQLHTRRPQIRMLYSTRLYSALCIHLL